MNAASSTRENIGFVCPFATSQTDSPSAGLRHIRIRESEPKRPYRVATRASKANVCLRLLLVVNGVGRRFNHSVSEMAHHGPSALVRRGVPRDVWAGATLLE